MTQDNLLVIDLCSNVQPFLFLSTQLPDGNIQTLSEMTNHDDRVTQLSAVSVDLGSGESTQVATLTEAHLGPDGHIILTGEDGTQSGEYTLFRFVSSSS